MIEREGAGVQKQTEQKCELSLASNGFNNDGMLPEEAKIVLEPVNHIEQPVIENAAITLGILEYNASEYDKPSETVNVSIDDVGVKKQTETRPKAYEEEEKQKRVDNTVTHVQFGKESYILNASSVLGCLKLLIGFLLFNGLIGKQIVVFTDGARVIAI